MDGKIHHAVSIKRTRGFAMEVAPVSERRRAGSEGLCRAR